MNEAPIELGGIRYQATPTGRLFHGSDAFVRGVMGPIGSGKSVMCVIDLLDVAMRQEAFNGVRKVRFAIIRNTYQELIQTSMVTWKDWVPPEICPITLAVPIHGDTKRSSHKLADPLRGIPLGDGTWLDMEVWFIALDKEEDIRKLKSLELTMAWINEACEIDKAVLKMLEGRVDRYPSKRMGGCTRSGIIMDTNPPDVDSWYYKLSEEECPETYAFFKQPPAVVPLPKVGKRDVTRYVANTGIMGYAPAENVENHNSGFDYWLRLVHGATEQWVRVFCMGQYGNSVSGKPIYPEYKDELHRAETVLVPYRGLPLLLGWDFGRTPTCIIGQLTPRGQLRILDELCSIDMGITTFARDIVKPFLRNKYSRMQIQSCGDPAGNDRMQTNEQSCLMILAEFGIPTEMAATNSFTPRREAVARYLSSLVDGDPGLIVSPNCKMIIAGFQGKYRYRKMRLQTGVQYANDAEKNDWSHPHDGLQYLALMASGQNSWTNNDDPSATSMTGTRAIDVRIVDNSAYD